MSPHSQQQASGDNSLAMLWGVALSFAILWMLWHFFHAQISIFILKVKLGEARFVALFAPKAQHLVAQLRAASPQNLQFQDLVDMSTAVGRYLRYPVTAILLLLATTIYFGRASLRFKKHYTMNSLIEAEKQDWPQIMPVAPLDLVKTDIDEGPWAMALSPLQFAQKYKLLRIEKILPEVMTVTTSSGHTIATLQRDAARRVFAIQLGQPWEGIERLSLPTRALFAIFAARAARDRDSANRCLRQIAVSAFGLGQTAKLKPLNKLDFSGVDALLKKHAHHKAVVQVVNRHAYVLTVMAAMLVLARQDGVLASADFLWLKPTDRPLWFMLNSVGRQTSSPEIAAPFAHWIAERTIGHRLKVPMVEEAVNALEIALKEIRVTEDSLE